MYQTLIQFLSWKGKFRCENEVLPADSIYCVHRTHPCIKDTIPLTNVCWKMPIFQSKLPITKYRHISLNSQFNVVLNSIICFSVRFCNNSLLMLKMRFQVFSFASKKVQGFSNDSKILTSLLSVLFHLQNCLSILKF